MSIIKKVSVLYRHWPKYSGEILGQEIKEVALNSRLEQEFWDWTSERMNIFYKKEAGIAFPWTEDVILSKNFFTNAYRELDKTTIWIHEWLLPVRHDFELFILNLLYARFCGKPETLSATGLLDFDTGKIAMNHSIYQARPEGSRVTSAYLFPIAGALKIGCPDRPTFFYETLPRISKQLAEIIRSSDDRGILELVRELYPIIGFKAQFHLTEVLMDVGYVFPEKVNEYKPLYVGPGAIPTCLDMNPGATTEQVVYTLMKKQPSELVKLKVDDLSINFTSCAVEQIACEVRKYNNLKKSSGRQRLYRK
jgi:hypothetical protein